MRSTVPGTLGLLLMAGVPCLASAQNENASAAEDVLPVIEAPTREEAPAAGEARKPPATPRLEEIVVTAQRREENIQDTPIAVSAFNQEALSRAGVANVGELTHVEPSLNTQRQSGVFITFLRGIGNNAGSSLGNEASVPVYIDDLYYTRLATAYLNVNSMERVEILKGPQGTLFGRNSSGGAIQMFTRDPGEERELDVSLGYANYDTRTGQLYLSTPLTDNLAWNMAVAALDQRRGYGKSEATGKDIYLEKHATVRSKLLWSPTDTTRVKLVGFYADQDGNVGFVQDRHSGTRGRTPGPPPVGVGFPSGAVYPFPPQPIESRSDLGRHHNSVNNTTPFQTEEGGGGSLRIDQELGFANLASITGARSASGLGHYDADFSPYNYYVFDINHFDRQISQEFQLTSNGSGDIDWIVGAYYLKSTQGYEPAELTGDGLAGGKLSIFSKQIIRSYSLYTQATMPVLEDTNLTLGVRYTVDDVHGKGRSHLTLGNQANAPFPPAAGGQDPYNEAFEFREPTFKIALDHHFSEEVMAYSSFSRGFKAGTFNTLPLDSPPAKAEIVDAYELGAKTELLDGRMRVNGAVFWNDIKSPQVLVLVRKGAVQAVGLTNAEEARVRGAEIGVEALATDALRLHAAATYLDAKYIRFENAPHYYPAPEGGLQEPVSESANGHQIARVPDWRYSLGADYTFYLEAGELSLHGSVDYTDTFPWDADNLLWEEAVTLYNANIGFAPANAQWNLNLWGKNLSDEEYYLSSQPLTGSPGHIAGAAAPRTYGVTVSMSF